MVRSEDILTDNEIAKAIGMPLETLKEWSRSESYRKDIYYILRTMSKTEIEKRTYIGVFLEDTDLYKILDIPISTIQDWKKSHSYREKIYDILISMTKEEILQKIKLGKKKQLLTIKEASVLLGVSVQTLKNWEKRGKIKPIFKKDNKQRYDRRYYTMDEIKKIERNRKK